MELKVVQEVEIVGCEVLRYDAEKNIFVSDKKLVAVEKCYEIRLNGKPFRKIGRCSSEMILKVVRMKTRSRARIHAHFKNRRLLYSDSTGHQHCIFRRDY